MSKKDVILIKIVNKKKITNVKFANSYFSRLKGLMFKKKLDYGLILKPQKVNSRFASGIHTCFMRIPIDIIFLNENKEVHEIKHLPPWKFYTPNNGSSYIIELEEGSVEKYKINIGDKLDFICKLR